MTLVLRLYLNKKVFLRERKRHTDHGVSSTTRWGTPPSQVRWWGTWLGGTRMGAPKVGYPPGQVWWGVPEVGTPCWGPPWPGLKGEGGYLKWGTPIGVPPGKSDWGVPEVEYPPSGSPQPGLRGIPEVGYPCQVWRGVPKVGYPHHQGTPGQVWPGGTRGGNPCQGTPCLDLAGVPSPTWTWMGYSPPPP